MAVQELDGAAQTADDRAVSPEWAGSYLSAFDDVQRAVREAVAFALQEAAETRAGVEGQAEALLQRLEDAHRHAQAELEQARRARQELEVELERRHRAAEEHMRRLVEDRERRCAAALREAEERRAHLLSEVAALQEQVSQIQKITTGLLDTRLSSLRESVHGSPEGSRARR